MIRTGTLEIDPDPAFADALCAQTDPDLFFPEVGGDPKPAKRICGRCPVRLPCLRYALAAQRNLPGVWGGATQRERARMRAHERRPKT